MRKLVGWLPEWSMSALLIFGINQVLSLQEVASRTSYLDQSGCQEAGTPASPPDRSRCQCWNPTPEQKKFWDLSDYLSELEIVRSQNLCFFKSLRIESTVAVLSTLGLAKPKLAYCRALRLKNKLTGKQCWLYFLKGQSQSIEFNKKKLGDSLIIIRNSQYLSIVLDQRNVKRLLNYHPFEILRTSSIIIRENFRNQLNHNTWKF